MEINYGKLGNYHADGGYAASRLLKFRRGQEKNPPAGISIKLFPQQHRLHLKPVRLLQIARRYLLPDTQFQTLHLPQL